jgi:hypothetical protein
MGNLAALTPNELRSLTKWFMTVTSRTPSPSSQQSSALSPQIPTPAAMQAQTSKMMHDIIQERLQSGSSAGSNSNLTFNFPPGKVTHVDKSFYLGILHRTLVNNPCYFWGGNINEYVYFFAGNGMMDTKDFSLPSTASEAEGLAVNFAPRRERFTFRKEHLEVLEMYFKKNQYPSLEERLEVALKCNNIMIAACKVLSFIISSLS